MPGPIESFKGVEVSGANQIKITWEEKGEDGGGRRITRIYDVSFLQGDQSRELKSIGGAKKQAELVKQVVEILKGSFGEKFLAQPSSKMLLGGSKVDVWTGDVETKDPSKSFDFKNNASVVKIVQLATQYFEADIKIKLEKKEENIEELPNEGEKPFPLNDDDDIDDIEEIDDGEIEEKKEELADTELKEKWDDIGIWLSENSNALAIGALRQRLIVDFELGESKNVDKWLNKSSNIKLGLTNRDYVVSLYYNSLAEKPGLSIEGLKEVVDTYLDLMSEVDVDVDVEGEFNKALKSFLESAVVEHAQEQLNLDADRQTVIKDIKNVLSTMQKENTDYSKLIGNVSQYLNILLLHVQKNNA